MSQLQVQKLSIYELCGTELKENVLQPETLDKDVLSLATDVLSRISTKGYMNLNDQVLCKISGNLGEFFIECYHRDFKLDMDPWDKNHSSQEGFPSTEAWLRARICPVDDERQFESTRTKAVMDAHLYDRDIMDACEEEMERDGFSNNFERLVERMFLWDNFMDKIINKNIIKSTPFVFYTHTEKAVSDRIPDSSTIIKLLNHISWLLMTENITTMVLERIGILSDFEELITGDTIWDID